jgi:hypothetical protein
VDRLDWIQNFACPSLVLERLGLDGAILRQIWSTHKNAGGLWLSYDAKGSQKHVTKA